MYYAVLWIDKSSPRIAVVGWTVHENYNDAVDIKTIGVQNAVKKYIYEIVVNNFDIDREIFKGKLGVGYYFTSEPEPNWMRGSNTFRK